MTEHDVHERLARLERRVEELQRELTRVTSLVADGALPEAAPTVAATPPPAATVAPPPPAMPEPPGPVAEPRTPLQQAWDSLERGRQREALESANVALQAARTASDDDALRELETFAAAAVESMTGDWLARARWLASDVRRARAGAAPAAPRPAREQAPKQPPASTVPVEPGAAERAVAWVRAELTGARAFALAGASLTLLGIVFLFVLAANRGWFGPELRVLLGAACSAALVGAGLVLRARYGRVTAAFAAAGAGIAGAYATLAAATILYDFVPEWAALLLAAAIAAAGGAVAVAWSSQLLAGVALVGAAAAPALVALDSGIGWAGTAFALVVLAAGVALASPRRWLRLEWTLAAIAAGQVEWLALAERGSDDAGAVGVTVACVLLLLAAAVAWQAWGEPVLDDAAVTLSLAAMGVALTAPLLLLSLERDEGVLELSLAGVFAAAAIALGRRWRDLAWTVGAEALVLGGVAAALLLSGRSLTIVWALEAVLLTALAARLRVPRFAAAGLAYLGLAALHVLFVEVGPNWPADAFDVPRSATLVLAVLAAATLAVALLLPAERRDTPSRGLAAALEPLWDALVRGRVTLRALLAGAALVLAAAAASAVLSERELTLLAAGAAAGLAAGAYGLRESRLQPLALGVLGWGALHALAVEVPPATLALERGEDALAPVPSLAGLALAAAVLALATFEHRGLRWLGALAGPELHLTALWRRRDGLSEGLLAAALAAGVWAGGLVAVEARFDAGHAVATAAWGAFAVALAAAGAQRGRAALQAAAIGVTVFALLKSAVFDWRELSDGAAVGSLLAVAVALLAGGFLARWLDRRSTAEPELAALAAAAVGAVAAVVALERVLDVDSRGLGVASLAVVAALAAAAVPPYLRQRSGAAEAWPRTLASGYGALALGVLLFAEANLAGTADGTLVLWGLTGGALCLAAGPLREERVWAAGLAVGAVAAICSVALVTPPGRLVDASAHPAEGLWALAAAVAALWAATRTAPRELGEFETRRLAGAAAAATLYGVSLAILELAELLSPASVETDFQRGHTALSAAWGLAACIVYVVGLRRDSRNLRTLGLTLFALSLAKLFLYDLSTLSSITRALSFLAVGAVLLAAGFFAERLVRPRDDEDGPAPPEPVSTP